MSKMWPSDNAHISWSSDSREFDTRCDSYGCKPKAILTQLSAQIATDFANIQTSLHMLQDQVDSLAIGVLQSWRALGLLTVQYEVTCLFLAKDYCNYANKSGIVRENSHQLWEGLKHRVPNHMGGSSWWRSFDFFPFIDRSDLWTFGRYSDISSSRPLHDPHSNMLYVSKLWSYVLPTPFASYFPLVAP